MLSRTKRELRIVEDKIAETAAAAKAIIEKAAEEGRSRTDDENAEIAVHHKALEVLKENKRELEDQRELEEDIAQSVGPIDSKSEGVPLKEGFKSLDASVGQVKSIGEQFVESEKFKSIQEAVKAGESSRFTTGAVSVHNKGTLLEGAGGGGGAIASTVPQVVGGVVDKLFQPLSVSDLILAGQATQNSLRYVVEGTATSGAAGVAEGAAKPESTLGLTTTDEPVKKIATTLVISDEMLEDAAQVQSYINGRLSLFVKIEEERQLVRGAGTNDLVGIMDSARSINIYAGGTAAGNKAVQLFKAMNGQRGSALVEPDFIGISPSDWQDIRLLTDTAGQFFGGGPFQGPYGSGSNVRDSGQLAGADYLWNKPVVVSSIFSAGTALIGTSSAAQVWRKGGLTVEATNSHSDYFTKNLVAIRAEERLALAVYRPTAFTKVNLA